MAADEQLSNKLGELVSLKLKIVGYLEDSFKKLDFLCRSDRNKSHYSRFEEEKEL